MGDLVLTCNSMASRNFSLGAALGEGKTLAEIMAGRVTVAEGVATAKAVAAEAALRQTDMPISRAVYELLHEDRPVSDIIAELLSRGLKAERE
jgi:glycerol-3-phosphate dehydrogenase (NAD(P)+)